MKAKSIENGKTGQSIRLCLNRTARLLQLVCVAGITSLALNARADVLLSASPSGGTAFSVSSGYYASSAAFSFTPLQDYSFTSLTVWLTGYDGNNGAQPNVSLWSNSYIPGVSQPSVELADLTTPAANDGTLAAFTFNLDAAYSLQAHTQYWLMLSESGPYTYPFSGMASWANGTIPSGNATFNGSEIYYGSGFQPSDAIPAFSIGTENVVSKQVNTVNAVPEPSTLTLGMLLIAGFGLWRLRQSKARKAQRFCPAFCRGK